MDNKGIMECIELMCDTLPLLRNTLNLTQEDFSKVIGVSRQSVINIEHKEKINEIYIDNYGFIFFS